MLDSFCDDKKITDSSRYLENFDVKCFGVTANLEGADHHRKKYSLIVLLTAYIKSFESKGQTKYFNFKP